MKIISEFFQIWNATLIYIIYFIFYWKGPAKIFGRDLLVPTFCLYLGFWDWVIGPFGMVQSWSHVCKCTGTKRSSYFGPSGTTISGLFQTNLAIIPIFIIICIKTNQIFIPLGFWGFEWAAIVRFIDIGDICF